MHNPYRGGTADVWYSGPGGDLWVEYKWIPSTPKKGTVKPKLEPLQLKWLGGRHTEGRDVCVVVGHPGGCVVFRTPDAWEGGATANAFSKMTMDRKTLAAWIAGMVST